MAAPSLPVQRYGPDGRFVRIPTPTGLGVGDIHSYLNLPEKPGEGLVLVDTGVHGDESWDALGAGLDKIGQRVEDIRLILLTHAHPDHFGQAARIQRAAGCPVWGHEKTPEGIGIYAGAPSPERLESVCAFLRRLGVPHDRAEAAFGPPGGRVLTEDVELDRTLVDGERLALQGLEIDMVHTPGHCPDLVVYWVSDAGVLLSGDHLLPDITPVCLMDIPATPAGERAPSLVHFHESLDKVEPLRVRLVLPSHGDVLHGHRRLIADYRLHTAKRALKIARLLSEAPASPFELARRMFPQVWDPQLHLVLSEVLGHLDLLERDGCIRCEEPDGELRYHFVKLPDPL